MVKTKNKGGKGGSSSQPAGFVKVVGNGKKPIEASKSSAHKVFVDMPERTPKSVLTEKVGNSKGHSDNMMVNPKAHQVLDDKPQSESNNACSREESVSLGTHDTTENSFNKEEHESALVEDCESSEGEDSESSEGEDSEASEGEDVTNSKEEGGQAKVESNQPAKEKQPKSTWSSLFKDNRKTTEGIELGVKPECDKTKFKLTNEDVSSHQEMWGFSAIGYIAGRFPGKQALLDECKNWGVKFKYSAHPSGWLIFQFEDEEDLNKVLYGGPYFIFQRPLLLKRMPHMFNFGIEELCHIPVWVRLPNLPLELWNKNALSKILSPVGRPIRTDKLTATRGSFSFARALVEVDASKELLQEVDFYLPDGTLFVQKVEYETKPSYCKICKMIGHSTSRCQVTYSNDENGATSVVLAGNEAVLSNDKNSAQVAGTIDNDNGEKVQEGNDVVTENYSQGGDKSEPVQPNDDNRLAHEKTNVAKGPDKENPICSDQNQEDDEGFIMKKSRNRNYKARSPSVELSKGKGKVSNLQGKKIVNVKFVGKGPSHQKS